MQPAEKQEFVQYLEKGGVIDTLTKVLVSLFEKNNSEGRPEDPVEFIKQHFFEQPPSKALEVLERENADLKAKVESLEEEIRKLKAEKNAPTE